MGSNDTWGIYGGIQLQWGQNLLYVIALHFTLTAAAKEHFEDWWWPTHVGLLPPPLHMWDVWQMMDPRVQLSRERVVTGWLPNIN